MAWQNPQSGSAENVVTASPKVTHVSVTILFCKPDIGAHVCLVRPVTRPVCLQPELTQLSNVLSNVEPGAKLLSLWHDYQADAASAVMSSSNTDSLLAEVLLKQLGKPDYSLKRNFGPWILAC